MGAMGFLQEHDRAIKEYKTIHPDDRDLKSFPWKPYYYNPLQLRQFNYKYSFGYAEWVEDRQRIRVGVLVAPSGREHPDAAVIRPIPWDDLLTADRCIDLLHDVKAGLLSLHPFPYEDPAHLMIMTWFSHNGQRVYSTSWLDQIIAITNIEVGLSSGEGVSPDLECSQALDGGLVTIHDHRQKQ
jgi:hypothetical protein